VTIRCGPALLSSPFRQGLAAAACRGAVEN
jgi:hypothetical protein